MVMKRTTFYSIEPILEGHAPGYMFYQEEKRELYLSANVRLSGYAAMAHIESEELANRFAEAVAPILQKRYGARTTIEVIESERYPSKKLAERIAKDSEIIKKRLETKNFSANKMP